jgi:proline dehydrogenase
MTTSKRSTADSLPDVLRQVILAASRSRMTRTAVEHAPVTRSVVKRFVSGAATEDAVRATRQLLASGRTVTIDHLGEDTVESGQAESTAKAYLTLLQQLSDEGLTHGGRAEVSLKLSALGQAIDPSLALAHATTICEAARDAGTTVTLDMEDHTTTDSTLEALRQLRTDFPTTGAVVQSYLRRTEADCQDLATAGSRVRLCKGAYDEPESVAFQSRSEVDKSYVRCLKVLMAGHGYPMVASHDPRMIAIAADLAKEREQGSYEYQMLFGIRPAEQERLAAQGETVRVYVPYGDEWYGYFMRRLAERPANVAFFLRAMATRS